ncbi:MAG: hypothetical protein IKN49_04580 [Elusimicrobiaceae bacterium]|nr:hypothetical protein [Candidatus Saccharibacteria bacterium]MBR3204234.1 hypothetical protein [Candidatus Saccharibacteria bacterium]MBR3632312.1 hypothetical protein [Elusimicrobiaceae bacterium]
MNAKTRIKEVKTAWKDIFLKHVKGSKNPQKAAKEAGSEYREKYGSTRRQRWKNAQKSANKPKMSRKRTPKKIERR